MMFTALPLYIFSEEESGESAEQQNAVIPDTIEPDWIESFPSDVAKPDAFGPSVWNGKPATSISGQGTEANPYLIYDGSELKYFADQVNDGNDNYAGKYVKLMTNIDMDMFGSNNDQIWTPIGVSSDKPFKGNFDGNGYEILNLNIKYDSGKPDSEVNYIGFFGYVENATISNLGIYNYKIDQAYNYDTEIGAMVAHAVNSKITNCYANGDITAEFQETGADFSNAETIAASTFSGLFSSLTIPATPENADKHGYIIDFSSVGSHGFKKIYTIPTSVSKVKLIGSSSWSLRLDILIPDNSEKNIYIELENFKMNGSIIISGSRDVYICSSGSGNSITANSGNVAINAPDSNVYRFG